MSSTDIAGSAAPTTARRRSPPRRKVEGGPASGDRAAVPQSLVAPLDPADWPDLSGIVTEDDEPVDNVFSEKQQRLLTEPLYTSWPGPGQGRPFLALANVGLFHTVGQPPLVPDMMLSLDVAAPEELWTKAHRSYFIWVYGKPPDVVVEVVSNDEGGEGDRKLELYARIGIPTYIVHDPERHLSDDVLRVYRLDGGEYRLAADGLLPQVGLQVGLWRGVYENVDESWLRWSDASGRLLLTGAERAAEAEAHAAEAEAHAAEAEAHAAEAEAYAAKAQSRAAEAESRAAGLAARLRALGVDPDAA
ncbi:MAG: Uma2 family endonuclease [Ardenticatenia bacterium]|nr:Uma2 family endonuclease [Ardenticatenia bacterium]